jgi:hypothetical protein
MVRLLGRAEREVLLAILSACLLLGFTEAGSVTSVRACLYLVGLVVVGGSFRNANQPEIVGRTISLRRAIQTPV